MMKPYPEQNLITKRRVYNYRHSRKRRISENLFRVLADGWRIYQTVVMLLKPTAVQSVILATLALHNMLMISSAKKDLLRNRTVRHRGCKLGVDTRPLEKSKLRWINVLSRKTDKGSQRIYCTQRNSRYLRWVFYEWGASSVAMGQMLNEENYRYLNFL